MGRHRDSIFNRTTNAYLRRAAEGALRRGMAFDAADSAVLLVGCQNDLLAPDGRGRCLTAGPDAAAAVVSALARLLDAARRRGLRVIHAPLSASADPAAPLAPIGQAISRIYFENDFSIDYHIFEDRPDSVTLAFGGNYEIEYFLVEDDIIKGGQLEDGIIEGGQRVPRTNDSEEWEFVSRLGKLLRPLVGRMTRSTTNSSATAPAL